MTHQTMLLEVLLGGFFGVACIRTIAPSAADTQLDFANFFRLPGRIERLRRSRWQWFSMVLILLICRLQNQLPIVLELMVALQFVAFLALPSAGESTVTAQRPRGDFGRSPPSLGGFKRS